MTAYGQGADLAAQCPQVDTPSGWRAWRPETDGPIPDALSKRAQAFAADSTVVLGSTESYPLPGVVTLIRVEPQVWGRDVQGNLVQGCFRIGGIYLPAQSGGLTVPVTSGIDKTVGVFTVLSLAVGTVATIAGLRGRNR